MSARFCRTAIGIALTFGLALSLSIPVAAETLPIPAVGDSGAAVVPIQLALTDASFNLPLTGYFGDTTAKDLQALTVNPNGLLHLGDRGPVVVALQHALTRQGYAVAATGLIGPFTASLIRRYQENHSLPATGDISLLQVESTSPVALLAATADALVGSPYAWGGSGPRGFDCSGFVSYVFARLGIHLAHDSYSLWDEGIPVAPNQPLEPGMLVFFNSDGGGPSHVGIYLGGDIMVHAGDPATGVQFASLDNAYWAAHYIGARQVIGV